MRTKLKKSELRKAQALAKRAAYPLSNYRGPECREFPEYLGNGAWNHVFALTSDLVVRVARYTLPDGSWAYYDWIAAQDSRKYDACPVVWHLGEIDGRRWAVVERMRATCLDAGVDHNRELGRGNLSLLLNDLKSCGYSVHDLHNQNIMLSKTGRVVCTDLDMYR